MGEGQGEGEMGQKGGESPPSPFCASKRGTRQAKRDAGGSHTNKIPTNPLIPGSDNNLTSTTFVAI